MLTPSILILIMFRNIYLPGNDLEVDLAKMQSRCVVVARIEGFGEGTFVPIVLEGNRCEYRRLPAPPQPVRSVHWTKVKAVEFLHGKLTQAELDRLPLRMVAMPFEAMPAIGGTYILFVNGNISKVLADIPENRRLIREAPATESDYNAKHRWGGGLGGHAPLSMMSPPLGVRPDGTTEPIRRKDQTKCKPSSVFDKTQEEFVRIFEAENPQPPDRLKHFAWLEKDEMYRRYAVAHDGWGAEIRKVRPADGGGWLVTVVVRPAIQAGPANWMPGMPIQQDTVTETYRLKDGKIRLVESDAAQSRPEIQFFASY